LQEREWNALTAALEKPEWATDPRFVSRDSRLAHDDELVAEIGAVMASNTAAHFEASLNERGAPCTAVTEVSQDKWLEAENRLIPAKHALFGEYWRPPAKVVFEGFSPRLAPAAGISEHATAILDELGYSGERFRELVDQGIVGEYKADAESSQT